MAEHDWPPETNERNHAIVRLYQEGHDMAQIAAHYGISAQRVSQIIRRAERMVRERAALQGSANWYYRT